MKESVGSLRRGLFRFCVSVPLRMGTQDFGSSKLPLRIRLPRQLLDRAAATGARGVGFSGRGTSRACFVRKRDVFYTMKSSPFRPPVIHGPLESATRHS